MKDLQPSPYNPRKHSEEQLNQLKESIKRFGLVDPIIVNIAPARRYIVIGGHMRLKCAKALGYTEMPCVFLNIPDLEREKELNVRLNKNTGSFDLEALAKFNEEFLGGIGFSSEELDEIFAMPEEPEVFDLKKELEKMDIKKVTVQKGDRYRLGDSVVMCGDSTIEADVLKLMDGQKADMCLTDSPYLLDYLHGKSKHGKATTGFGYKRDRRYLETDVLPDNFTELWMANVARVQKPDFSIIAYENWRNVRTFWNEMEKHWKIRNMIIWHLSNRNQGFAGKYRLFSKHDIAMVATSAKHRGLQVQTESELLENEYQTALYAISGKPTWEGYEKGKKYAPTDFIEYHAADEKSSGQGIVFGTKPIQILIPYIKVLTKRHDLILEPFGGSGSTLIAATKMQRRCFLMEKSPVYAQVILKRWSNLTGLTPERIDYV
ncbi:MAG: DNA methyltransferase [Parcubacteria group bacterium]